MNRRGFLTGLTLAGCGAAAIAPAIIRTPGILMRVSSRHLIPVSDRQPVAFGQHGSFLTVKLSLARLMGVSDTLHNLDGAPATFANELVLLRTHQPARVPGTFTMVPASAEDAVRMGQRTRHRVGMPEEPALSWTSAAQLDYADRFRPKHPALSA